jgi:hypothetical protein
MTDVLDPDVSKRAVLKLDPRSAIAIKRDVRVIDVGAPAADFASAFAGALEAPNARFGLIEIIRLADRTGKPFEVGERFQGRFDIEDALLDELKRGFLKTIGAILPKIFHALDLDRVFDIAADALTSDYGEITMIDLKRPGGGARLVYDYLEGTPIAGSSTFVVEPLTEGRSRCTQIVEYQEQSLETVLMFGSFGLKLHNQVVYQEVKTAADALGAPILSSDIPY